MQGAETILHDEPVKDASFWKVMPTEQMEQMRLELIEGGVEEKRPRGQVMGVLQLVCPVWSWYVLPVQLRQTVLEVAVGAVDWNMPRAHTVLAVQKVLALEAGEKLPGGQVEHTRSDEAVPGVPTNWPEGHVRHALHEEAPAELWKLPRGQGCCTHSVQ